MAEKRKPKYTLLLRKQGNEKTNKVELFPASLWKSGEAYSERDNLGRDRFRIRVNGKWWPTDKVLFVTKTKAKELFFKNIES